MKVVVKTYIDDYDGIQLDRLFIDGDPVETIGKVAPEDAIIGRDPISGRAIAEYIKKGYDASEKGEDLTITYIHCEKKEDFWYEDELSL